MKKIPIYEHNAISGGLADGYNMDDMFNYWKQKLTNESGGYPKSLKKMLKYNIDIGIKVEMEHTDDESIAKEIAMDHLKESFDYYQKLKDNGH